MAANTKSTNGGSKKVMRYNRWGYIFLLPFFIVILVSLLLITYVDPLTTWLPSLLKK